MMVDYETEKVSKEFGERLGNSRDEIEEFIGGVEMALTLLDDTLTAGIYLRDQTHDTEVLERFHSVTTEMDRQLSDETVEKMYSINPVFLQLSKFIMLYFHCM